MRYYFLFFVLLLNPRPVRGQFTTSLEPETVAQFEQYAAKVEQQLQRRWHSPAAFLSVDGNAQDRDAAIRGELVIRPADPGNPVAVNGGLIHDWVATMFIPDTSSRKVLEVLEDYDAHRQIYPNITNSRLLHRDGNNVSGYWRLEWKRPLLQVVLDVEQDAHYEEIGPGKWISRAYAKRIWEVESPGTAHEKKLPLGEGRGFLWRLYAYWSLEMSNGGVFAECRTLSLSRSIPPGLAWAIEPFVQSLPRESLASTMRSTQKAATK